MECLLPLSAVLCCLSAPMAPLFALSIRSSEDFLKVRLARCSGLDLLLRFKATGPLELLLAAEALVKALEGHVSVVVVLLR